MILPRFLSFFNYQVNGETSTYECAHQLGKLCENRHIVVNLIPYNSTDVKDKLVCPSEDHVKIFQNIVSTYGVLCFIRRTMGAGNLYLIELLYVVLKY